MKQLQRLQTSLSIKAIILIIILYNGNAFSQTTKIFRSPTNESGNCIGYDYVCGCQGWCTGCHHAGKDYCGTSSDNIVAIGSGRIAYVNTGENRGLGQTIIIAHKMPNGQNMYSLYAHLSSISSDVVFDKYITKGFYLGKKGKTGAGSNNIVHLHFELKNHPGLGHNPDCFGTGCVGYVSPDKLPVSSKGYFNPASYIGSATNTYNDISLNSSLPNSIPKNNVAVSTTIYSPFTQTCTIDIRLSLYTTGGSYLGDIQAYNNKVINPGSNTIKFTKAAMISSPGNYKLQIDYKVQGEEAWVALPVNSGYINPKNVQLVSGVNNIISPSDDISFTSSINKKILRPLLFLLTLQMEK